ncbi:uncharacterized protein LOC124185111 isoform X1 [Neodiprion fabricii]|uniref:uncharacterized protein LOC124185111 isoform X1 n=1 Tax=Neodiprion fabricii TaxID=2872261 RepID=UPI001ED91DAC|nr:uncharacterized protein LOC124185111 isoform X1 [Neodiprion fabricii]
MSERQINTAENMSNSYCVDEVQPLDVSDIIDVSAFDFSDDERWLHVCANCSAEGNVQDLNSWLGDGLELDLEENEALNGTRRSIDTRTFTRHKKRNNRLSFESIIEALSPPASNVWKRSPALAGTNVNMNKEISLTNSEKESVPAMLNPTSSQVRSGILGSSGQESMEAFLNLSQSKGIDSFINLTEPEFADPLMNVSQPSELGCSLMNMSKESLSHQESIVDSQILTNSMMKTSMFGDISDINDFNDETFLKEFENNVTIKNRNACGDNTFTTNYQSLEKENEKSLFNTFTRRSATSLPRHSLPIEINKQTINTIFTSSPVENIDLDETLTNIQSHDSKLPNGLNSTFLSQKQTLETVNITLNLNHDFTNHTSSGDQDLRSDFSSDDNIHCNRALSLGTINSTFNGPTDLRRELLEQVHRSAEQNLDSTYSHITEVPSEDISAINHNNTYRKKSPKLRVSQNESASPDIPTRQNSDKKYYTFTKKTNMADLKAKIENEPSPERLDSTFAKPPISNYQKKLQAPRVLSKLPQLFQKSNPNLATNSMRTFDMHRYSNVPNSKYARPCQPSIPRNVEGSLVNKLMPLGRLKSGSEQRLLEVGGNVKEFRSKGASGSTESIESTQSAHSAPDLDDRLSICSDSSHTSYNLQLINSAQLHYIAGLQEQSLKQISTPKPNRRVLENNWMEAEKDLPSPILKGACQENEHSSSQTVTRAVKNSSPLLEPVGSSLEAIGTSENHINDVPCVTTYQGQNNLSKKPEMLVRPMKHAAIENKTRLRAPTNWGAPNRTSSVGSGIPRPASRIPAPRFSRPSYANNQTEWKKGCS